MTKLDKRFTATLQRSPSKGGWTFALGGIALALVAVIASLNLTRMLLFVKILLALSLFAVALGIILLAIYGRADFQSSVTTFGGDYDRIISAARSAGFRATPPAAPLCFGRSTCCRRWRSRSSTTGDGRLRTSRSRPSRSSG